MYLKISLILLLFFPTLTNAGFFDSIVNEAKKIAEDTVNKTVDSMSDSKDSTSNPSPKNTNSPATTNIGKATMTIEEISADRRSATLTALSLARLRYDQGWLTDKNLVKATELSISCQQLWLRQNGLIRGNGCMGEYLGSTNVAHNLRLAPVFANAEIEGRNPKFAAEQFKDRMKSALLKLAQRLPPEFGDTVRWRASYDFKQEVLNVTISGYEQGVKGRVPEHVRHLDLRNPRRANFDGTQGEYYRLKAWMPYVGGITTLAFDRDLNRGRITMSPAEAEKLFQGLPKGQITSGTAIVEFRVDSTSGEAAIATLEQVRLLSTGAKSFDLATVEPFMTLPAETFPKLTPPQKKALAPQQKVPSVPATKPAKAESQQAESGSEPGPYLRVEQGKPYGPDLVGLQLGMTLDEADHRIRAHKKPREVVTGKPLPPFVQARGYLLEPGDEAISLVTLASPAGERVAGYVRQIFFDPGKAPTQIALAASLEKKYADPTYVYDVQEMFDRRWLSDWKGEPIPSQAENTPKCERAVTVLSGPDVFGKDNGRPYLWFLPWLKERAAGSLWSLKPGDPKRIENVNRCGPSMLAKYGASSGDLMGPTLTLLLFDGAWIIDAVNKRNATEAAQGAKDLSF